MGLPAFLAPAALFCMVLFAAYMLWEIFAWVSGNKAELTSGQFIRRMSGGVMLFAAMLLLMMANQWMDREHHSARERLNYLSWIMILTLVPMMLAVREAAFIARQYARKRAEILRSLRKNVDAPP
jgi:cytochrome bd-type quinol oxidase subunit 2